MCRKCSEIVPAAIASIKEVNIRNDSFHVESAFKYLGDTIGQCGVCSGAVSALIVSSWKAFELPSILTNCTIRIKVGGNVFNMCVRKVLFYVSETWPVVHEDVQRLVTADSGMIRWICHVSLKDLRSPDFSNGRSPFGLGVSPIKDILRWIWLRFYGHFVHMEDNAWPKKATMRYVDGR